MLYSPPHLLDTQRWRGMRIGLLGGSFNPPHAGHIHISEIALKRLGLDCVWWLVTPQNPLKPQNATPDFNQRFNLCRDITRNHPRLVISDLEIQMRTSRTIYTLKTLKARFPHVDFVFLMGSDLAPQFHRWTRWRDIPRHIALAVIERPPALEIIQQSRLYGVTGKNHVSVFCGSRPALDPGIVYKIITGPTRNLSSTMIRNHF